jgi:hypothetical protein
MTLKFNESKLWDDAEVPHAVGIEEGMFRTERIGPKVK